MLRVYIRFAWILALTVSVGSSRAAAPALPQCLPNWKIEVVLSAPAIRHPSVVCCAPDGRVFIAEDPMDISSSAAHLSEGRIVVLHPDGRTTVFADHLFAVFGMQYLEGKLYVLHNPKLSVFDDSLSGPSTNRVDLIESTNPNPWALDWNDHVPANFRLGMDGYFYLAVGDKGLFGATGRDRKRLDLQGGGVVRFRPNATELEVFSSGVRNILDVAINAEDEVFTYDNTDEQQWMSRLTHMVEGGFYGYPYDFIPQQPYTLWMMADYGGGAATGAFCYNEDALPPEYHGNLFLADFGKRQVMRVQVARAGGTYQAVQRQDFFTSAPADFRPVGIALAPDGLSIYICDWNHADTKEKVVVGRLLKLTYTGPSQARPKPEWYPALASGQNAAVGTEELLASLAHPSREVRLTAQREIVHRALTAPGHAAHIPSAVSRHLTALLSDRTRPWPARAHALWALDAIDQARFSRTSVLAAAGESDAPLQRQAIRQLGLRQVASAAGLMIRLLRSPDASIRFYAATALGRLAGSIAVAPLQQSLRDDDLFARYAAFTALNRIGSAKSTVWPMIVAGLNHSDPRIRDGTALALRETYDPRLVMALLQVFETAKLSDHGRRLALQLLADAQFKPPAWKGEWWAYHPVNSPPPAKTVAWEASGAILNTLAQALNAPAADLRRIAIVGVRQARAPQAAPALRSALERESDPALKALALRALGDLPQSGAFDLAAATLRDAGAATDPALAARQNELVLAAIDLVGNGPGEAAAAALAGFMNATTGRPEWLKRAIDAFGRIKTMGNTQALTPFIRHASNEVRVAALGALVKRSEPDALVPFLADTDPGVRAASINVAGTLRVRSAIPALLQAYAQPETRADAMQALVHMPDARAIKVYVQGLNQAGLREAARKALLSLDAAAVSALEHMLGDLTPENVAQLQDVFRDHAAARKGPLFQKQPGVRTTDDYAAFAQQQPGTAERGQTVFNDLTTVACVRCHRVRGQGNGVGPELTNIGTQFSRQELVESILFPSRKIREGYQQIVADTHDGESVSGRLLGETVESLTLLDGAGATQTILKSNLKSRTTTAQSLMPEGLHFALTPESFADLIAYLVSLK